jgi:hypothetical protein
MTLNQKQLVELSELITVQLESILDCPDSYEKDAMRLWLGIQNELNKDIMATI